jgi:hypothetical protein
MFFFVALHLIAIFRVLMLKGTGIAIYLLIAMLVHYLERLVDYWREAGGLVAGNQKLLAEILWPHFWAIQILLLVLILMYCAMREFVRVIGADQVRRMFFGPLHETQAS